MNTVGTVSVLLAGALLSAPRSAVRRLPGRGAGRRLDLIVHQRIWIASVALVVTAATLISPPIAVLFGTLAVTTGVRLRRRRREVAGRSEGQALAAALDVLVGELQVGAHPVRAIEIAAGESVGTVAEALRRVASRARLGADVGAGLRVVAAGSAVPAYWNRVSVCWSLAAEHGLAISSVMRAAQRDIVDRQRFADRTRAGLAGARATAAILAALPILGVLLGELIGARPVGFLLNGGAGSWLLAVGVCLICGGLAWSARIIDRVLP